MKKKILFIMEEMAVNGAVKSLLALLEALDGHDSYDISLFVSSHDGVLQHRIPRYVKVLPELIEYAIFRLPLKKAVARAAKSWRFDLVCARLFVGFCRKFRLPFPCWFMLPQICGEWDAVCAYADGFVAQMAIRKVAAKRKALWIHCDYTQYRQSQATFEAFKKADVAVSVSQDSIKKFKEACGEDIDTPFAIVHNIIDVTEIQRKAAAYAVPAPSWGGY